MFGTSDEPEQDNLYRSLGLGRTAGRSEIASAYRRMARLYHVDRHPEADREHAARRWAEISGAHEVLNDPRRRFLYDTLGPAAVAPGALGAQTAVGAALKTPEQLREQFMTSSRRAIDGSRDARLRASASSVCSLSVAEGVDALLDARKRRALTFSRRLRGGGGSNGGLGVAGWLELMQPELTSAAGSTSMRLRLSRAPGATVVGGGGVADKAEKETALTVETSFVQRNGLGASTLALQLQRALSERAAIGCGVQLGASPSAHSSASRRISERSTLALSGRVSAGGATGIELHGTRALGSRRKCELVCSAGAGAGGRRSSGVTVRLTSKGRAAVDPNARAAARKAAVAAEAARGKGAPADASAPPPPPPAPSAAAGHGVRARAAAAAAAARAWLGAAASAADAWLCAAVTAPPVPLADPSSVALRELLPALPPRTVAALRRLLERGRWLRYQCATRGVLRARASAHVLSWSLEARANGLDLELAARCAWRHSATTRTRLHASLSLSGGLAFSAATERLVSRGSHSSAGATVQWGRSGGYLKLKAERGGFRVLIPIYLGGRGQGTLLVSAAWALVVGTARWVLVEPQRRKRRAKQRASRVALAAAAEAEARECAAAEARIRGADASRLRGEEEDYDGLVIDVAVYGLLPPAGRAAQSWLNELCRALGPQATSAAASEQRDQLLRARGLVDVSVVLQSLVEKGALSLPAGSKAGLPAFHRPQLCAPSAIDSDGVATASPLSALGESLPPLDVLAGTAAAPVDAPPHARIAEAVELIPADAQMRLFVAYRLRGEVRRAHYDDEDPVSLGAPSVDV